MSVCPGEIGLGFSLPSGAERHFSWCHFCLSALCADLADYSLFSFHPALHFHPNPFKTDIMNFGLFNDEHNIKWFDLIYTCSQAITTVDETCSARVVPIPPALDSITCVEWRQLIVPESA